MPIDLFVIANLLRTFKTLDKLSNGEQLHCLLLKSGHISSLFSSNSLLQFYSRCSSNPMYAQTLFDSMPIKNSFSYNTLMDSYLNSHNNHTSFALFQANPCKYYYSWVSIITGLVKCGDLISARTLFDEMPDKDITALNSLINGYLKSGLASEGLMLYKRVCLDDKYILATVVSGCADYSFYSFGKQIHAHVIVKDIELDSVLGSTLVDMYSKCEDLDNASKVLNLMDEKDEFSLSALVTGYSSSGRVEDAKRVFDSKKNGSNVLWNSMINGYVFNDRAKEALSLFIEMRRTIEGFLLESSTFASAMGACVAIGHLETGKHIHGFGLKLGVVSYVIVASVLIDFYSKCGEWRDACKLFDQTIIHDTILLNSMINVYSNCGMIGEARKVFDSIANKTQISWNSMIVGYCQNAHAIEAFILFTEMQREGHGLDKVSLASVISASALICNIELGEQLFSLATVLGLESDPVISTSVIDLYCKTGSVSNGWKLFSWTEKSDKILWNAMMMGYASNGYGTEVIKLFKNMRTCNILPDVVTFIAILTGCCHSGLVEDGLRWFKAMKEYDIEPSIGHYALVIDMLVRVGRIEEAVRYMNAMPFKADEAMLTSVLGACKVHGDVCMGNKLEENLMKLDLRQAGTLVQMSSVHAARGKWEVSEKIRKDMRERKIRKNPGCSWIEN